MIKVGIIGFGTVGSAAARLLAENREDIHRRAGFEIVLAAVSSPSIARRDTRFLASSVRRVADWREVVAAPDVDIVAELVGGTTEAADIVASAIKAGKTVVTANKNLLAECGTKLEALARQAGVGLECEAAVAGGIPVLGALREGLSGDRIEAVYGILNGTANFILTTMEATGRDLADVLAEAQRLGYAEADPRADVEGWDARQPCAARRLHSNRRPAGPRCVRVRDRERVVVELADRKVHACQEGLETREGWLRVGAEAVVTEHDRPVGRQLRH